MLVDAGVRVKLDDREHLNPGAKFYEWERKGVPFRIELGPRDLEKGQVALARRVVPEGEKRKDFVGVEQAVAALPGKLDDLQRELRERAEARREDSSYRGVTDWQEMKEIFDDGGGFVYTGWNGDPDVEERVKDELKATLRCIPSEDFRSDRPPEKCISGEGTSKQEVLWARAY